MRIGSGAFLPKAWAQLGRAKRRNRRNNFLISIPGSYRLDPKSATFADFRILRRSPYNEWVSTTPIGLGLLFTLATAFFTSSVQASETSTYLLRDLPCAEQVLGALDHWEPPTYWHPFTSGAPGTHLASPTDQIGTWLYINVDGTHVTASRRTENSDLTVAWNAPECASESALKRTPAATHLGENNFVDEDLATYLEKSAETHSPGIIYTWSPHMPLSIEGLKEVRRASKKLGFQLLVLLDPNASPALARRVAKKNGFPDSVLKKTRSAELVQRDVLYHYPSYTYFRDGKLLGMARPGYDEPKRLEAQVQEKLKQ